VFDGLVYALDNPLFLARNYDRNDELEFFQVVSDDNHLSIFVLARILQCPLLLDENVIFPKRALNLP
jgi:hypothetical protein